MFEGLGAELPDSTKFVVEQRAWLYPAIFGAFVIGLVVKEPFVRDKRLSTMLSLCVTIVAQFLAHWFTTVHFLPFFDLINKLG